MSISESKVLRFDVATIFALRVWSFFIFSDCLVFLLIFFFFSSRRRHTRYIGDWSSDVCSSDLISPEHPQALVSIAAEYLKRGEYQTALPSAEKAVEVSPIYFAAHAILGQVLARSEERRVGKECRCRWWREHERKRQKSDEERWE